MIIRILSLFFSFILFSPLSASEKTLVTSFYPIHVATLNIVENISNLKLINLTKPFSGCLHDYQLTPQEMITLSRANYFIINGAGMESFLNKALRGKENVKVIDASFGISLLKNEIGENNYNPHVWLNPQYAIIQVENITSQLSREIPEHKNDFEKNAKVYIAKLEKLRDRMKSETKILKSRSFVTFHEAFSYLAKELNLTVSDVIEREPGTEPTAKELSLIITRLKKSPTKVVFAEPQYSVKSAETIARESGASLYFLDPVVTGDLNKDAYLKIMYQNLEMLKKALK